MIGTIEQRNFDINHPISGNDPPFESIGNTAFNSRDELSGNNSSDNCILKFKSFTPFFGFDLYMHMAILSTAA